MKKLSIIVPVYNVEDYIEECIESLLVQTLENIEIIVVNDGSKDDSMKIVEKFNDERIILVNRKNGGLSAARNTGLKIAKGEYIAFVDSDDFIGDKNAYKEMYEIAKEEKSDIVAGNALFYYSKDNVNPMIRDNCFYQKSPMNNEEFFIQSLKTKRIYAPVWLNIYKRSLILDNKLLFKEGIFHEDELFTPQALIKANQISIYNNDFYVYRQREGSIINSGKNGKKGEDKLKIVIELNELIKEIHSKELKNIFSNYLIKFAIWGIYTNRVKKVPNELKEIIKGTEIDNRILFKSKLINISPIIYLYYEDISNIINIFKYKVKGVIDDK